MKYLKYIAFSLVLVASVGVVHASDSGRTSPGSDSAGYTSGEDTRSLSSQSTEAATQFDIATNQLFSLSRDPAALRAGLANRIKKVSSGARSNTEMEDPNVQQIYMPVDLLLESIRKMQHVGVQKERIEELQGQLRMIVDEILPNVSATDATGESDLSPNDYLGSHARKVTTAIKKILGCKDIITEGDNKAKFSEWAARAREFFSRPENQDSAHSFFTKLLHSGDGKGLTSPVEENSVRERHEEESAMRLFCYHLARAAGYDADDLIVALLREMKEAIQGGLSIVKAFNKILISDVRPLLLEVKLLENPEVLESYFQGLLSLAHHTRDGIQDSRGRVIYTAYGAQDEIYTELQRVYSSLQIHVIRLRIETAILPALEAELGNKRALEEAQREQDQLRAEQEEKRINAMTPEKRRGARSEMLQKSISEKMKTLRDIVENQVKEAEIAKDAEVRARFSPLLEEAEGSMVGSKAEFDSRSVEEVSNPAAVFDLYKVAKNAIDLAFEGAKTAIEAPIRDRLAEINELDARRAAKLAELRQVNAGDGRSVDEETLKKLDAMWGGTHVDIVAERNWRAEGTSKVSASQEAEIVYKAQNAYVDAIVSAITAQPTALKKGLQRPGRVNAILTELRDTLFKVSADRYADIVSRVVKAGLEPEMVIGVDSSKINTGREELFARLQEIMSTRIN